MTQVQQSYYVGLTLRDTDAEGRGIGMPVQTLKLNFTVRTHWTARYSELSVEDQARYLDEIAVQFEGRLRRFRVELD